MRSWIAAFGFLCAVAAWPPAAAAQTRLFSDHTPLELVLEAPLSTLLRNASRSVAPHPATLRLVSGGAPATFQIQLSARGLTRRRGGICTFPPLRLDFRRSARRGTPFQGQERLKLVTHCKAQASYEQRVVLEYLAYRLYNAVTPLSFRVRPVQITYRDSEGRRPEEIHFGFLIEDVDDVAARNRRTEREAPSVAPEQLDPDAAARYALFQYMIGNLDWSFLNGPRGEACCHNAKLIAAAGAPIVPLPYDFDHSGLVDAPYATPPQGIRISSVRTRVYRGLCRHNDRLPAAAASFRARRAELMALIAGETRLSDARRQTAQRYLDEFFDTLSDSDRFERAITRACRGGD